MNSDDDEDTEPPKKDTNRKDGNGARNEKVSSREYVMYRLDTILSKKWALCAVVFGIGAVWVFALGLVYSFFWTYEAGSDPRTRDRVNRRIEGIWEAWTFMADPGTHAKVYLTDQRLIAATITLGGILFFASILGMTVDLIREKMESLRQGKTKVVEKDHTLILGWTQKTFHIIEELCDANSSEGGGVVAVLAPERKGQMEEDLKLSLPERNRHGTRIVFRSGSPLVMGDLIRVSVHSAKAIIILATTSGDADQADADTLRTLLSLRGLQSDMKGSIIAEARDIDNEPLVKLVGGGDRLVETLVSHDMIGRLMLWSVRQPGLAKVYEALLGFAGDEFYMKRWPQLVGCTFGELAVRFEDAVPIGLRFDSGIIRLKPPPSTVINEGDEVIVIAADNDTYKPESAVNIEPGEPPEDLRKEAPKERIMICGWRRDVRDVLKQLDRIVSCGTEVHMMTHCVPVAQRDAKLLEDGLDVRDLKHIQLKHHFGNTSVRRRLEELPIETFSSVMIFADQAFEMDTMHADSHSLATLLLIRTIQLRRTPDRQGEIELPRNVSMASSSSSLPMGKLHGNNAIELLTKALSKAKVIENCPIVCEILDPHTQKTVECSWSLKRLCDFCQTNRLIAQVMAMVSEERSVKLLLDELLGSHGCNIGVVHSERYASPGERLSFQALARRAGYFDELLIGYQRRSSTEKTVLNPPEKTKRCTWDNYDLAILQGNSLDQPVKDVDTPNSQHTKGCMSEDILSGLGADRASIIKEEHKVTIATRQRDKGTSAKRKGGLLIPHPCDDQAVHAPDDSLLNGNNLDEEDGVGHEASCLVPTQKEGLLHPVSRQIQPRLSSPGRAELRSLGLSAENQERHSLMLKTSALSLAGKIAMIGDEESLLCTKVACSMMTPAEQQQLRETLEVFAQALPEHSPLGQFQNGTCDKEVGARE